MKISIDTKEDSHEEIKKVIKMLNHLVGESSYSNQNIFEDEPKSKNIFDDPSPSLSSTEPIQEETAAPTNAFSAMFGDNPTLNTEETSTIQEYEEEKPKKLNLDEEIIPY
jgi:hypothetical protein